MNTTEIESLIKEDVDFYVKCENKSEFLYIINVFEKQKVRWTSGRYFYQFIPFFPVYLHHNRKCKFGNRISYSDKQIEDSKFVNLDQFFDVGL